MMEVVVYVPLNDTRYEAMLLILKRGTCQIFGKYQTLAKLDPEIAFLKLYAHAFSPEDCDIP